MQREDQQAYDRGTSLFSPDGRLYQVEYAREAVKRGSATVGVRTADSVVLAAYGETHSPLLEPESIEKLHDVDGRLGVATAGHVADGRRLVDYTRQYAQEERLRYGEAPAVEPVAKATADFIQESTQTGGTRPFGASLLVGGLADGEPSLYEVDPSGTPYEWRATAIGNRGQAIRELLEARYDPALAPEEGRNLALEALTADLDATPTPDHIAIAEMTPGGFVALGRDQREAALENAGFGGAS